MIKTESYSPDKSRGGCERLLRSSELGGDGGVSWQEAYIFSENTKQVKEMKMV